MKEAALIPWIHSFSVKSPAIQSYIIRKGVAPLDHFIPIQAEPEVSGAVLLPHNVEAMQKIWVILYLGSQALSATLA